MRFPIENDHYGYRFLQKGRWDELHPGEDLNGRGGGNADLGLPIVAPFDGTITHVARNVKNWGNHFHLKFESPFGKRWCHFGHCNEIFVNAGDQVKEGQKIATVGNSGGEWTSHLHYEIKKKPTGVAFYPTKSTTKEWILDHYENPAEFTKRVNQEDSLDFWFAQKGISEERRLEYVKTLETDREAFWRDLEEEKEKTETYENLRKQIADILNCSPDFPAIIGEIHRLMEDADKEGDAQKQRDTLRKIIYDVLGDTSIPIDDENRLSGALKELIDGKDNQSIQLENEHKRLTEEEIPTLEEEIKQLKSRKVLDRVDTPNLIVEVLYRWFPTFLGWLKRLKERKGGDK